MKHLIFTLFLGLILFQSCDKEPVETCENCNFTCIDANETDVITNACIDNWECTFRVTDQSQIDLTEYEGRGSGVKNVFQMITFTQEDTMIADDEYNNILVFELDENQNSFSVEDSDLAHMNVHYRRVCFCSETDFIAVNSGCLQGEKQSDGTWFVQGKLNVSYSFGNVEVKVDAQFMN